MLPIHEVLDPLKAVLADAASVVLVAPPGAGKTTVTPLALMDEPWAVDRRIVMLEPRRLAARAAAERMARALGEVVGERVGYRVRLERRVSAQTRVEVVTEGVFTRMVLDDPGLDGIAAVIFDEFHERSLDADLGLAFARDVQKLLRPDLKLIVMSATLDGARIARLLDDAPVLESAGRQYPVETRYLGRDPSRSIEEQAARVVRAVLSAEQGGVLVFLPGQGEINRTAERLSEAIRDPSIDITPLYGALDRRDQDRAMAPPAPGRRKVVLATSIAQTSLTLEGVRVVVDAGLSRVPRFDPASGLTRLATVRVSRASADQRRGRAGRTEPGVCYRLWDEAETRALPAFDTPEILETDLSRLALDLARWGARDAGELSLLDPPPAAALREARKLLEGIGALDSGGGLTGHGRRLAELPLPPRLAHMVLAGAAKGRAERAARIAMLLSEQGLGGADPDVRHRLRRWDQDTGGRASDLRALASRWARTAGGGKPVGPWDDGLLLAEAFPERVARARASAGEFLMANGRGAWIDPADALAGERWLAVGALAGGGTRDRILLAAPIEEDALVAASADRILVEEVIEPGPGRRLQAKRIRRLGAIVVDEQPLDAPSEDGFTAALLADVRATGLSRLPWATHTLGLRSRVGLLRRLEGDAWPDLSDEALMADIEAWAGPLLEGRRNVSEMNADELHQAVLNRVPWDRRQALDRLAPERWQAPTGSRVPIDYAAEGDPTVAVRVQELFGLGEHPSIVGGRTPLVLALLSPAHRPIQVTRDLPGFWRGSWKDVRSEMRGRYPKHHWPEDPASAAPTTRAKPRG